MQAAASRSAGIEHLRPDRSTANPQLAVADDIGLLDALPIAAAVFCLKDGKLWIEAANTRFLDLAECRGAPEKFAETFKHYAGGTAGKFTLAYLKSPGTAP